MEMFKIWPIFLQYISKWRLFLGVGTPGISVKISKYKKIELNLTNLSSFQIDPKLLRVKTFDFRKLKFIWRKNYIKIKFM